MMTRPESDAVDKRLKHSLVVPTFPLSSPTTTDHAAIKSHQKGSPFGPNEPFLSPSHFISGSSDDESGSTTSGQDEFHLERYSQETQVLEHKRGAGVKKSIMTGPMRDQSLQQGRWQRPGLNIVTDIRTPSQRPDKNGLVIETVQIQQPKIGTRSASSVVSARADHGRASPPQPEVAQSGFIGGTRSSEREPLHERTHHVGRRGILRPPQSHGAHQEGWQFAEGVTLPGQMKLPSSKPSRDDSSRPLVPERRSVSPADKSIVIGISLPEHEAEAHRARDGGDDSALSMHTPATPTIIVTPATEPHPWNSARGHSEKRPISSIYSTATPQDEKRPVNADVPPIPDLPAKHTLQSARDREREPVNKRPMPTQEHLDDFDVDEEDANPSSQRPAGGRSSSESQERILPSSDDFSRPKSQGWWNLMLSPLLSRSGTSRRKSSMLVEAAPPVPALPAMTDPAKTMIDSPASESSPETPRRLGLANAQVSTWSRWTSWEAERGGGKQTVEKSRSYDDAEEKEHHYHHLQDSNITVPVLVETTHRRPGLAAEYYHACAVEQQSGIRYFECQNHSCAEKLPALHSIFDTTIKSGAAPDLTETDVPRSQGPSNFGPATLDYDRLKAATSSSGVDQQPEAQSLNIQKANPVAVTKSEALDPPKSAPKLEEPSMVAPLEAERALTSTMQTGPAFTPRRPIPQPPNIAAVMPRTQFHEPVTSPGPVSPILLRSLTSQGALPMADMRPAAVQQPASITIHYKNTYGDGGPRLEAVPWSETVSSERPPTADIKGASENRQRDEPRQETAPPTADIKVASENRQLDEPRQGAAPPTADIKVTSENRQLYEPRQETATSGDADLPKKSNFSLFKCMRRKRDDKTDKAEQGRERRWIIIIGLPLLLLVIACVVLATQLTRAGDGTPVESQWLNLTGYPPIPTGISTIARPDPVREQSQCVQPTTLWSCSVPKEDQAEISPNNADQPNFRFEVVFRNGTTPANMTIPISSSVSKRSMTPRSSGPAKRANDPFTNDLFTPNPSPPSRADQIFMGNTTDNVTQPFEGEETPFYMTFIPAFPVDPSAAIDDLNSTTSRFRLLSRQTTNLSSAIPAPDVLSDGSAAPANLLPTSPYPTSQPIRLYNRGQTDEHYGFYIYYDKAIFLHSTAPLNSSALSENGGVDPEDENGGAARDQSRARCTFSQTRFLVKIWTSPNFDGHLLGSQPGSNSTMRDTGTNSSATDFTPPGSFSYPTTITLDRHGGDINKKAVYCYGVDNLQVIQNNVKSIVSEDRAAGGQLINPAPPLLQVPGENTNFDPEAGGIDGGTGGCECVWQNWS